MRVLLLAATAAALASGETTVCADAIHSRVTGRVMRSAAALATELFADTGVRLVWKITEAGKRTSVHDRDPCEGAGRRVLLVVSRFSPREGPGTVLGEASLPGSVTAYYHRIENYGRRTNMPADVLLGYVIAHELGHLLLRSQSHMENGVMRADWRPHELAAMLDRRLRFDRGITGDSRRPTDGGAP